MTVQTGTDKADTGINQNLWDIASKQFELAADKLNLEERLRVILGNCKRELTVHFPVKMSTGKTNVFTGYRVHHNVNMGPARGGIRYHPNVNLDQMRAFAMENTWRAAMINVPFGGGAGGVVCDPRGQNTGKPMAPRELENMTRRFTTEIELFLGPQSDVLSPEINLSPEIMAWVMDTYSMHHGHTITGVVTGKPQAVGGSALRDEAGGLGVRLVVEQAAKLKGMKLEGATVAIEGFGNTGSSAASLLHDAGAKIIALSDLRGAILAQQGLDPIAVERHKRTNGSVVDFSGGERLEESELLELPCDILVLAGLEAQIDEAKATRLNTKLVVEAANLPTTPEADQILFDKGVFLIPDLLANAAGLTLSYFEWVQDLQSFFWDEDEVRQRLRDVVTHAFQNTLQVSQQEKVDLRTAALMISINRVAEATRLRGIYP